MSARTEHPRQASGRASAELPERAYRLLLRLYPADFRAAYGREMTLAFHDLRREADARGLRFWVAMMGDVARSAPGLRAESLRARWSRGPNLTEGTMRAMAILTLLVGVLETAGAVAEGRPGGPYPVAGAYLVSVALVVVAGALLVAAGIAMLRRTPRAAMWARGAATACLVTIVVGRLVHPWMSILSLLLGVALPVALLLFLRVRGGSGPSAPMRAR